MSVRVNSSISHTPFSRNDDLVDGIRDRIDLVEGSRSLEYADADREPAP